MMETLIGVPILLYVLLTFVFSRKISLEAQADAFVKSHIVLFLFVAFSTEILSMCQSVDFPSILSVWLPILAISAFLAVFAYRKRLRFLSRESGCETPPRLNCFFGVIAFVLGLTFITAMLYPPNNYDSMTYHMARVANWIINTDVTFYPTEIIRQNYMMPLAEFAILHIQILVGSDVFANLVQWVSFFVLIVLASLIAAELGLDRKLQVLSAVITATIPMAILQSSSTQNDLVVAAFVLSFALYMLRLGKALSLENLLFSSAGLGLALLTKGTAYIFCAPIGIILSLPIVLKVKSDNALLFKTAVKLLMVVLVALIINFGHFFRNYQLYAHPLSHGEGRSWNRELSVPAFLSNVARNASLHFGTPSKRVNLGIYRFFELVLGSQLNNPKTTYASFRVTFNRHEDTAGNPIHMIAAVFGSVLLIVSRKQRQPSGMTQKKLYAISVLLGAGLFCWLLKWQPWSSRLHTPLFALSAPLLAILLTHETTKIRKYVSRTIIACMILYSFQFVLANRSRPLIIPDWKLDRARLYFQNRPALFESCENAVRYLEKAGAKEAGLYMGDDDWEYPFWVFAHSAIRFRHVGVSNISRELEKDASLPEFVIATKETANWDARGMYIAVQSEKPITILKKKDPPY